MVKAQPGLQLTSQQINGSSPEPPVKDEIARIMNEYYTRLGGISPGAVAGIPPDAVAATNTTDDNGQRPKNTVCSQPAGTTHSKADRRIAREDSQIINESRRKVQEATTSLGALQKELNKMEAYKKVLSMVRRSLNATNRNFWDSVYTTTDNTI
jgi:hypothetical protein